MQAYPAVVAPPGRSPPAKLNAVLNSFDANRYAGADRQSSTAATYAWKPNAEPSFACAMLRRTASYIRGKANIAKVERRANGLALSVVSPKIGCASAELKPFRLGSALGLHYLCILAAESCTAFGF